MSQHPLAFWSLSTTDILRHCNFKWPRHSRITSRKRTQLHSACPVLPAQFPHVESESSVRERWEPAWGGSGQSTATTPCSATLEGPRSYRILCEKLDLMLDPARCTIAQPLSCISCTIPLHT